MAKVSAAVLRSPREGPHPGWRVVAKAKGRPFGPIQPVAVPHRKPFPKDEERCGVQGRIVTTQEDFYDLQATWRELSSQTARNTSFRSWDFAVEWFECFVVGRVAGATGRFQIVVVQNDEGQVVGLLPLFEERLPAGNGTLGTTLQPFGRGNSFDPMTDEPIVLLRAGYEEMATEYFRSMVPAPNGWSAWDVAVMDEFETDRSNAFAPTLLAGGGKSIEITRYRPGVMKLTLPKTWGQFKAGLSKSMRDNVAYYPRKLTRALGTWTIRTARSPADVARATEALIALHRQRSRSRVGTSHISHISTDAHATFIRRWFRRLAWRNGMSIMTVEIDGEVLAAQAFIEGAGTLYIYYSGYDERLYRCSPLTVIMAAAIEDAIARSFDCIDFPPVPTHYKSRWGALEEKPIVQTFLYSMRLPALLRGAARRFSRTRLIQKLTT